MLKLYSFLLFDPINIDLIGHEVPRCRAKVGDNKSDISASNYAGRLNHPVDEVTEKSIIPVARILPDMQVLPCRIWLGCSNYKFSFQSALHTRRMKAWWSPSFVPRIRSTTIASFAFMKCEPIKCTGKQQERRAHGHVLLFTSSVTALTGTISTCASRISLLTFFTHWWMVSSRNGASFNSCELQDRSLEQRMFRRKLSKRTPFNNVSSAL